MKFLKLNANGLNIEVIPHEFVTYAGKYRVPKLVEVNFPNKRITLEITNLYSLKSKNKSFEQRIEDYNKAYEKYLKRVQKEEKTKSEETEAQTVENTEPKVKVSDFLF
jgi:hypothetical protein